MDQIGKVPKLFILSNRRRTRLPSYVRIQHNAATRKPRMLSSKAPRESRGPMKEMKHLCPTRVILHAYEANGMEKAGRTRKTSPRLKGQRRMRIAETYISTLVGPIASWHDNLIPPHKDATGGRNAHFLSEEVSVLPMGRGLPRRRVFCPRSTTNMDRQTNGNGYEHQKDARRRICALCHLST